MWLLQPLVCSFFSVYILRTVVIVGPYAVATGSGRKVGRRARVAAVFSWPQAAWMALPLVSRTVTGRPAAARTSRKASTRPREDGWNGISSTRFQGMRLT